MVAAGWRCRWAFVLCMVAGLAGVAAAQESDLALAVLQEARALAARGEVEPALEKTERALAFARAELGPYDALVGFILDDLASLNYRLGRLDEALARAREALPVLRAARGPASIGYALVASNLASILSTTRQDEEALPLLEGALPVLRAELGPGHPRSAAVAQNLALVQSRLGMVDAAMASFASAIESWEKLAGPGDPRLLLALLGRAQLALDTGDLDLAEADASRAAEILGGVATPRADDLAAASLMLAEADLRRGRPDDALTRLQTAAEQLEGLDLGGSAATRRLLDRLATLHLLHREYAPAEDLLLRGGEGRDGVDEVATADRLARLAEARIGLGRLDEAEQDLRDASDLLDAAASPPPELLATVRRELARLDLAAGRTGEARARLEAMLPAGGAHAAWTETLLGHALARLGEPAAAHDAFTSALTSRPGDAPDVCPEPAAIQLALAELDLADGDFIGAKERLKETAEGPPGERVEVRLALADLELADGRLGEALALVQTAAAGFGRRSSGSDCHLHPGPAALLDEARRLAERMLDIAAAATAGARTAEDLGLMLEIAQQALLIEGQGLREGALDALAEGDHEVARLLRERNGVERAIAGRRALLARHRLAPDLPAGRRADLREEVERLERQAEELARRFRSEAPPLARLADPTTIALADLQESLDEREAVLVQVTTERITHLFLIRRSSVAFAQTEVIAADLATWVDAARREIQDDDAFDSFPLHALHAGLVSPFAASLDEVDHLFVLPDRAMRDLPFAVLVENAAEPVPAGGDVGALDFLIERMSVGTVPSLGTIGRKSAPSAADLPLVGLAAPRSADEPVPDEQRQLWLNALAAAVAGGSNDVVLDLQARPATLDALDLERFRVVGLAMPSAASGASRALPLPGGAGKEAVGLAEIARLPLDADMVVLRSERGGDWPALAPVFLIAGARSVAVGHWPAPPEAAAMIGRAARVLAEQADLRAAEALRRAARPLIAGEQGALAAHPRVWGAFSVLSGG